MPLIKQLNLLYFVTHSELATLSIHLKQFLEIFLRDMMYLAFELKVNSMFENIRAEILQSMWIIRDDSNLLCRSCRMREGEFTTVHLHFAQQALVAHIKDDVADMGSSLFSLDDELRQKFFSHRAVIIIEQWLLMTRPQAS